MLFAAVESGHTTTVISDNSKLAQLDNRGLKNII
jgi:hypothetical protein